MPIDVSRSLFIKNDAGEFVPVPMLKGEPGPKGDKGEKGDPGPKGDANVTFETITNALGYIAADDAYVQENAQEISQINELIAEIQNDKADKSEIPNVPVKSVSAGGTAIAPDAGGNVNIPVASSEAAGTVRVNSAYGLAVNNAQNIESITRTADGLKNYAKTHVISRGTLENVLAAPSTMPALTTEEQAAARERIGVNATVFIAEYGNTLYDDIIAAVNAGEFVVIRRNNDFCPIATVAANGTVEFGQVYNNRISYGSVTAAGVWSYTANAYAQMITSRVNTINASSTTSQYPSAKAVYDFVMSKLG